MFKSPRKSIDNSPRVSTATRQTKCLNSSSIPCTAALLISPSSKNTAKQWSYEALVIWSPAALEELEWWRDHLAAWNGKVLLRDPPTLIIEIDASTMGWGAFCGKVQTQGLWSQTERLLHINCLEPPAGGFALKSFLKNRWNIHVIMLMDNTSAIRYINKMRSQISLVLSSLAFDLWQ